jgi:hypothetical protein
MDADLVDRPEIVIRQEFVVPRARFERFCRHGCLRLQRAGLLFRRPGYLVQYLYERS